MNKELDAIDAVSRAVDRITRHGRFAEFTLSNGIILALKPVPPLLIQAISQEFEQPAPPKVWMEEKGRDEENPNDPEYAKLIEKLEEEQNQAVNDLLLGVGTSIKFVPEGFFRPEEDGWVQKVKFAASIAHKELEIEEADEIKRYLCWLRFYAFETSGDAALAVNLTLQLGGIREGEITEVLESFRSLPERGADTERPPETGSQNGNRTNRAARRASS